MRIADELRIRRKAVKKAKRPHRRFSRWIKQRRRNDVTVFVVILALIGGVVWMNTRGGGNGPLFASDSHAPLTLGTSGRPSPQAAVSKVPLGLAPSVSTNGKYLYEQTQTGSASPVAYDPCRPVQVVINDEGGPAQGNAIIRDALTEMSRVTGLQFNVEGATDEPAVVDRPSFQKDRYGDRWAPVLIGWSDPEKVPVLKDDVAGIGGSSPLLTTDGTQVYVSGRVVLDGPQLSDLLKSRNGYADVRSVVLHELGHVVGLNHVTDATQLMNPVGSEAVTDFGDGDRVGLAALGRGACVAKL